MSDSRQIASALDAAHASVRCLLPQLVEKDPKRRVRDIGDVRIELDDTEATASAHGGAPSPATPRAVPLAIGGVILALAAPAIGGTIVWRFRPSPTPPIVTRFSIPLPNGQQISRPLHQFVAISPDGTRLVYVANGRLYLRELWSHDAHEIPGTLALTAASLVLVPALVLAEVDHFLRARLSTGARRRI